MIQIMERDFQWTLKDAPQYTGRLESGIAMGESVCNARRGEAVIPATGPRDNTTLDEDAFHDIPDLHCGHCDSFLIKQPFLHALLTAMVKKRPIRFQ